MTGNIFLAVDLSVEERHGLSAVLSDAGLGRIVSGKRTRPENWHITLRFIGEAEDHQIDRLAERTDALLDAEPATIHLTAVGGFPKLSKASVLFLAVEDESGTLDVIAADCEEAAIEAGFEPGGRPFSPTPDAESYPATQRHSCARVFVRRNQIPRQNFSSNHVPFGVAQGRAGLPIVASL